MAPIELNGQEIGDITLNGNTIGEVTVNGTTVFKPGVIQNGLDLHYTFENANSGTVTDLSPSNRNGNVRSGTVVSETANGGYYVEQNGGGEGVSVQNGTYNISSEKTIQYWHYNGGRGLSTNDDWQIGFLLGSGSTKRFFGTMYGVNNVQDLGVWGYGSAGDLSFNGNGNKWVPEFQWVNIALTMDSNLDIRWYLNGNKLAPLVDNNGNTFSDGVVNFGTTIGDFEIGDNGGWSGFYIRTGETLVYDRALSQSEIQNNIDATSDKY